MERCISSQPDATIAKNEDACEWVSQHLQEQKTRKDQALQIIYCDKDGLKVRKAPVPLDFTFPHRTRKFTDLTPEENNYLIVVHALSKIVYSVIKEKFDKTSRGLNSLRYGIFENTNKDLKRLKRMQKDQFFTNEKPEILDLKAMIAVLKERICYKENKKYVDQLDIIDSIRREIVQIRSGILNKTKFQDIMKRMCEAVSNLGENKFMEDFSIIQQITNILEHVAGIQSSKLENVAGIQPLQLKHVVDVHPSQFELSHQN
ncbi:unnamed protein product [Mytilus coruscus]|uniref:Uncharacterized protein n=1 Tax=Mytilus coruscus TaxID=42192 RepID=A0A6J7ZZN7_MYTCO|nr:unnamed protein product [Mytilus coruscus]